MAKPKFPPEELVLGASFRRPVTESLEIKTPGLNLYLAIGALLGHELDDDFFALCNKMLGWSYSSILSTSPLALDLHGLGPYSLLFTLVDTKLENPCPNPM